ncbi:MAG: TetR/AcrR family transcriptional regulator [Lutispora sp.]|nr:TetR/AcrR family transcriptional regulator [Lutispora sp.]MDD4834737.1 TetR/AcrR family transcriptional regulator [Lutispora sp.]
MDKSNINYKDIILAEAKDIAIKQGMAKINIRSVAKNSGIAIGTVYNYFPSKGDLLAAVIEDFWDHAFKNVDWQSFEYSNFYDNLEKLYSILYVYLNKFKENWLEQLAFLNTHERVLGKKKQNEYFKKIRDKIIYLMDMDESLGQHAWTESVSKAKLAEFTFDNMLVMLRKGEKDMHFFIIVLKKIMSD